MKDSKHMRQLSCRRIVWVSFTNAVTFFIPNVLLNLLGLTTKMRRQAWKEKVAIFVLCLMITALFYIWLLLIVALFCDPPKTYDYGGVYSNASHYSTVNGQVLDWNKYGNETKMTTEINLHPHTDLSPLFPKFILLKRPAGQSHYDDEDIEVCINGKNRSAQADKWLEHKMKNDPGYLFQNNELVSCPLPHRRNQTGAPCFFSQADMSQYQELPKQGELSYNRKYVRNNGTSLWHPSKASGKAYVILDNDVLDMTDYLYSATNIVKVAKETYSRMLAADRMFLPLDLTVYIFLNLGKDITEYVNEDKVYKKCLRRLFYHGVVDGNTNGGCSQINVGLWITLGLFFIFFLIKMHMASLTQFRCIQRLLFETDHSPAMPSIIPHVLLFVPFYSEPSETIRQTFDSLARTTYPDDHKLLFFVCDGITQSRLDTKPNYMCVLDALGYSSARDPELRAYVSLGQGSRKINYARVYSGFYESGRNRLPFIMVVKVGSAREDTSCRALGNRGKRDSMLITLSFLERCLNLGNNLLSPLEFELYNQCYHLLGLDPRLFKYMLVTDADIQVQADVIHRLVSRLEANPKTLALSGYIRPANPEENLMTMLQIFPVYMMYFSGLAYEACMGGLMTLNGGFAMYRVWTTDPSSLHFNEERIETPKRIPTMVSHSSSSSDESDNHRPQSRPKAVSLQPIPYIQPISIHPTVLRGFATPKANTLHMESTLLLGEEQYLSLVLLQSHPGRRLGFDPQSVAYTTLPTHFFALQGLYTRAIRASLHVQLEFQHLSKHLGVMYWVASSTKLLDWVFSVPIMVYLYNIVISYLVNKDQANGTIACFFLGLVGLHIVYLFVHRQFKYIFWFVLYCLFGIPLFHIYLPLLAVWRSDGSHRWCDVWPTSDRGRYRLHGIIEDKEDRAEEMMLDRRPLCDFEQEEAEKNAIREKEHAEMLDAKFNEFTGYVGQAVAYPAAVQIRNQHHKRYGSGGSTQTGISTLNNPFEDKSDTITTIANPTMTKSSTIAESHDIDQNSCTYSLTNSVLSLQSLQITEELEGRSAPVHSKLASYL
ncbi:chitin synthase-domain-containing protein [Sporodiniella umbellata]|nr:chitin synthase-domain-containing protein [Sporodiniella umbellata]